MRLDRPHDQALTRALPHDDLVQLSASLSKRESLRIWLDKDMTWLAPPDGRVGRPAVLSDAPIQFCQTIKVRFKLLLPQTTGMVASLLEMAGLDWAVPD